MAIDNRHSYGFENVGEGEKQSKVNHVFARVADRYDLMNDVMSGGLHRVWKNHLMNWLNPPKQGLYNHLDVAGGTGDISFRLLGNGNKQAVATILDISGEMLRAGRERSLAKSFTNQLSWTQGNAESLPFEDMNFDSYTIAFGIRNVPDIAKAVGEAYRVLKPGGRFLCLEFSQVELPVLEKIYDQYSFHLIPKFGELFTGDGEPYQYLVESIRKFPKRDDFADLIRSKGFEQVKVRVLSGGIAAIHSGWRI